MMNKKQHIVLLKLLLCFLFVQNSFGQYNIPEIPKFQTSLYDYANILNADEKSQLEEKLIKYSDSTTTQIVVITIENLNGEDIGILTPKWLHQWGLGTAKDDNGVLILLARDERKIWISAGYGLEDRLTAGIGGEIIRGVMIPEFKAGSYYNGLDKGADEIFKVFNGKYKGIRQENTAEEPFPIGLIFLIIIIIIFVIISRNNSGSGGFRSGGLPSLLDVIILSNMGRSGGGSYGGGGFGGSSGGGGFGGGFGGGGSSGGGSGGSW